MITRFRCWKKTTIMISNQGPHIAYESPASRGRHGLLFIYLLLTTVGSHWDRHGRQDLSIHELNKWVKKWVLCCQKRSQESMAHPHHSKLVHYSQLIQFPLLHIPSPPSSLSPAHYADWLNAAQNIFSIRREKRNLPLVCLCSVACQPSANISILGLCLLPTPVF